MHDGFAANSLTMANAITEFSTTGFSVFPTFFEIKNWEWADFVNRNELEKVKDQ